MWAYFMAAGICAALGAGFGMWGAVDVSLVTPTGTVIGLAQNLTAAGASCGFAIAAGVCVLAGAVSDRNNWDAFADTSEKDRGRK